MKSNVYYYPKIIRRRLALIFVFLLGLLLLVLPVAAQADQVLVLEVSGPVTPAMANYFSRGIELAEDRGAAAVVIVLDTPGGAVDTTLRIVQIFQRADVPVIIYVGPAGAQAASAGSVITMAAHASGMAPQTIIGAASPIAGSGEDIPETAYRKIVEDLKATVRGLTEHRGEEAVALAEAMIEEARAVNYREALEVGLIDAVAVDVTDLLEQLDGLTVEVNQRPVTLATAGAAQTGVAMTAIENTLHALSNPLLIGLLMFIGVQALLIELSNPGTWIPGLIGVLCLALAFYGLGQLPANWLGLGLIALAFVLFVVEVTTATTGVLAVAGTIVMVLGLLVLFNSPGSPEFARISVPGAVMLSLSTAAFFIFLLTKALQAQRRLPVTGSEALTGQIGRVRTALAAKGADSNRYVGSVLVMGELWRAESDEAIEAGEEVVVKDVRGFNLKVKKV